MKVLRGLWNGFRKAFFIAPNYPLRTCANDNVYLVMESTSLNEEEQIKARRIIGSRYAHMCIGDEKATLCDHDNNLTLDIGIRNIKIRGIN